MCTTVKYLSSTFENNGSKGGVGSPTHQSGVPDDDEDEEGIQ